MQLKFCVFQALNQIRNVPKCHENNSKYTIYNLNIMWDEDFPISLWHILKPIPQHAAGGIVGLNRTN